MKLLLDTTYLLPAIGISVRELQEDALSKSEISIFELPAEGAKHIDRVLFQQRLISI